MSIEDKRLSPPSLPLTEGSSPSSLHEHPGDEKVEAVAQGRLLHQVESHSPSSLSQTKQLPGGPSTVSHVAAKTLLPLEQETLRKWENVRALFEETCRVLSSTVPEGCGAYLRIVAPKYVEDQLGKMEFRAGSTGGVHGECSVDERTLANLASSGKLVTALMAAILEESGHLRLTDSISRYFPQEVMEKFQRDVNGTPIDPSSITLGMLASMTAGITYDGSSGVEASSEEREHLSHDEILREHTRDHSIAFMARPGDGICTYSNMQMQLLAYAIEKAYKEKSLRTLLETRGELGERTIGSFLEKGYGRLGQQDIPERLKKMTLRDFEREVMNPHRQNANIDGINIHDILSDILGQEAPLDTPASFEEILNKEFFQPLGMEGATYGPGREVRQEGRVLTIGTPEDLKRGEGIIPSPDNSRNGAGGAFFMTPADEAKLIQALLSPSLKSLDGRHTLISEARMNALFAAQNRNLPSWTVGGAHVERTQDSDTVGKGGDLDQYHHFFQWERMRNPARRDESFGIFMWNNFNGTPNDGKFGECFGRLYGESHAILQGETAPLPPPSSIKPIGSTTLQNAPELVAHAEKYFFGDRDFFAYSSKEKFLCFGGKAYALQTHGGKDYIFIEDRPVPVSIHLEEGKPSRIQIGSMIGSEFAPGIVKEPLLPERSSLVPQAEIYFQGDRGLFAYKQNQFLYWAGVSYRIQEHQGQEYIFFHGRPTLVQHFDSPDGTMRYIQLEDNQGAEISRDHVLEAASTPTMQRDLKEAKELFREIQGTYHGDHQPTGFHDTFREISPGTFCLCPPQQEPIPLQLTSVHRDGKGRIDEIHMTWNNEPVPDKAMHFVRNTKGSWDMKITEFLTDTLCETCIKV